MGNSQPPHGSPGIYEDGSYIRLNPSLHAEDSPYKFHYIHRLLGDLQFPNRPLRILDIGGGAGLISRMVCDLLAGRGFDVEAHALDASPESLAVQRGNNPYLSLATTRMEDIRRCGDYDLTLLVDVVEHVPDHDSLCAEIDRLSRYVIYNIPVERNLFDLLRNLYFRGQYYGWQSDSLGHIHFFSARTAKRLVARHHRLRRSLFPDYPGHLLTSDNPDYVVQRSNPLRLLELRVSKAIFTALRPVAPFLIQGSLFMLAESRARSD